MVAIAFSIFVGACLIAGMFALSAVIISSRISRQEEQYQNLTTFQQGVERIITQEQPRERL